MAKFKNKFYLTSAFEGFDYNKFSEYLRSHIKYIMIEQDLIIDNFKVENFEKLLYDKSNDALKVLYIDDIDLYHEWICLFANLNVTQLKSPILVITSEYIEHDVLYFAYKFKVFSTIFKMYINYSITQIQKIGGKNSNKYSLKAPTKCIYEYLSLKRYCVRRWEKVESNDLLEYIKGIDIVEAYSMLEIEDILKDHNKDYDKFDVEKIVKVLKRKVKKENEKDN